MKAIKTTLVILVTVFLFACASDSHIKEKMATGYYSEVATSLGFKFTYGYENADKYTNFQLGLMALNGYFLRQQASLVRESFEDYFESHITDTVYRYWSSETYAMEFLIKSAQAGFPPAMMKLADILQDDESIYGNAAEWIYKAAAYGQEEAVDTIKDAGKEAPKLLISQELANQYTLKGREIEDIFRRHDVIDAAERNSKHQQVVQQRIAFIKNVVIATAAIAVAGHVISETNGTPKNTASYTPYVPPLIKSTPLSKASQVKAIRSASPALSSSIATSSAAPTSQTSKAATSAAVGSTVQTGQCSSDYNCGINEKCVKAPLSSYGTCMSEVNQYNLPTFSSKEASSVLPNMDLTGQCRFNTDCPVSFKCDQELKVCTK